MCGLFSVKLVRQHLRDQSSSVPRNIKNEIMFLFLHRPERQPSLWPVDSDSFAAGAKFLSETVFSRRTG